MEPATEDSARARGLRALTSLEARVLGVLIEKGRTVPDTYPLTLNALVAGCNQKSNRNPVLDVRDAPVLDAVEALKGLSLVIESSGSRVMRYAQNFKRVLLVPTEAVALLATLMLRGPQTAAELRANSERLCRISDLSATEAFLRELASRSAGALVMELPRQRGSRENRWMHRLCGDPDTVAGTAGDTNAGAVRAATPSARQAMAVNLPQVQAEVSAQLERYGQALSDSDSAILQTLFWESPDAMLDGECSAAAGLVREAGSSWAVTGTRLVCFGNDFAVSLIELNSEGAALTWRRTWREGQSWVRLPQGWRIVATHRDQG